MSEVLFSWNIYITQCKTQQSGPGTKSWWGHSSCIELPIAMGFQTELQHEAHLKGTFMESCCIIFNCMIHWQNAFKSSSHLNLFYFSPLFSFVLPEAPFGIFISWHKQATSPVLRRFREMMAVCETVWVVFYQFDHFSIDFKSIILWICVIWYRIVAFRVASGELRPASCLWEHKV